MFALMHQSVNEFSKRMSVEMRRNNYVTPTNFLELVDGFKQLRSATLHTAFLTVVVLYVRICGHSEVVSAIDTATNSYRGVWGALALVPSEL